MKYVCVSSHSTLMHWRYWMIACVQRSMPITHNTCSWHKVACGWSGRRFTWPLLCGCPRALLGYWHRAGPGHDAWLHTYAVNTVILISTVLETSTVHYHNLYPFRINLDRIRSRSRSQIHHYSMLHCALKFKLILRICIPIIESSKCIHPILVNLIIQ